MPSQILTTMSRRERALAGLGLLMVAIAVVIAVVGPPVAGLVGATGGKTVVVVLVLVPVVVATSCLVGWGALIVLQGIRLARRKK